MDVEQNEAAETDAQTERAALGLQGSAPVSNADTALRKS